MTSIGYVIVANIVVWAVIGGYVAFLAAKGAETSRRLKQLELLQGPEEGAHG
jgi:CcmD family protein